MSEFIWPVRVYYEDTDAGGVVYYANYLRFMERARTEWLRALGFEQDALKSDQDILFVVRSIQVEYRSPALFNDRLAVSVRVMRARGASITFVQQVRRDGKVLCDAGVKVACLNAGTLRPRPLPSPLVEALMSGPVAAPEGI